MQTVWQVEKDEFARKVLAKHWPDVRKHDDVCTFPPGPIDDWKCDLICGGFPCQDISHAGKRAGIDGSRSGLWSEFIRIVRLLRPRYVLVENVSALLVRGMDRVLGDLAASGYDAEWDVFSAAFFGAPHHRERLFLVAYPAGFRCHGDEVYGRSSITCVSEQTRKRISAWSFEWTSRRARSGRIRLLPIGEHGPEHDGIPDRLDEYRCLGNAVVPQCSEFVGRLILSHSQREF